MRIHDRNLRLFSIVKKQVRTSRRTATIAFVVSAAITIATYIAAQLTRTPLEEWVYDPNRFPGIPPHYGFLTYLSIFGWAGAAAISLFSSALVSRSKDSLGSASRFLFVSGLLSAVLGVDDAFLLHEDIFPKYLGIPEALVLLSYGAATGVYLFTFRKLILTETRTVLLALAGVFFGLSVGLDISPFEGSLIVYLEDSSKLTGIIFWLTYFTKTALDWLVRRII